MDKLLRGGDTSADARDLKPGHNSGSVHSGAQSKAGIQHARSEATARRQGIDNPGMSLPDTARSDGKASRTDANQSKRFDVEKLLRVQDHPEIQELLSRVGHLFAHQGDRHTKQAESDQNPQQQNKPQQWQHVHMADTSTVAAVKPRHDSVTANNDMRQYREGVDNEAGFASQLRSDTETNRGFHNIMRAGPHPHIAGVQ